MRSQFTFYESFFKAISRIKKKQDRADAYDMICAYALYQEEPDLDSAPDSVAIAFDLLRPVLDKAKAKAEIGKAGGKQTGSKPEANAKQTGSKPEANGKQTVSKKEGEKEKEKEKEVEVEKEVEIEKESYYRLPSEACAELRGSSAPDVPAEPPFIALPLLDGTEYPVTQAEVTQMAGLYLAIDVPQAYRNMRAWLLNNPKNRKTKAGIKRFINNWLSGDQNRARPDRSGGYSKPGKPPMGSGELGEAELEAIRQVMAGGGGG